MQVSFNEPCLCPMWASVYLFIVKKLVILTAGIQETMSCYYIWRSDTWLKVASTHKVYIYTYIYTCYVLQTLWELCMKFNDSLLASFTIRFSYEKKWWWWDEKKKKLGGHNRLLSYGILYLWINKCLIFFYKGLGKNSSCMCKRLC